MESLMKGISRKIIIVLIIIIFINFLRNYFIVSKIISNSKIELSKEEYMVNSKNYKDGKLIIEIDYYKKGSNKYQKITRDIDGKIMVTENYYTDNINKSIVKDENGNKVEEKNIESMNTDYYMPIKGKILVSIFSLIYKEKLNDREIYRIITFKDNYCIDCETGLMKTVMINGQKINYEYNFEDYIDENIWNTLTK